VRKEFGVFCEVMDAHVCFARYVCTDLYLDIHICICMCVYVYLSVSVSLSGAKMAANLVRKGTQTVVYDGKHCVVPVTKHIHASIMYSRGR
jgi:hypothetical protein